MLSRKHYKMIAEVLREAKDNNYGVEWVSKSLCYELKEDDPNFNRDQFLNACGVTKLIERAL